MAKRKNLEKCAKQRKSGQYPGKYRLKLYKMTKKEEKRKIICEMCVLFPKFVLY